MQIVKPQVTPLQEINGEQILLKIQDAAKTCYQTHKDTDNIESAKRIVKQLIQSGHLSMLEFGGTIGMRYITNIAGYKDLRTHRLSTWAVESTRWANYSKGKFNGQLTFLDPKEFKKDSAEYAKWAQCMKMIEESYMELAKMGAKPDQLSLLLPQSTKAEANVVANLVEWRHILSLRSSIAATGHARPSIVELMDQTLELFHDKIPVVFDDLYEQLQQKRLEKKYAEEQKKQLKIQFDNNEKTK